MHRYFVVIIALFVLFTSLPVSAGVGASPDATRLARDSIDSLMRLEFDSARRILATLKARYPDYPMNSVLNASVYWVMAEASQSHERQKAWIAATSHLEKAMAAAEQGLEKNPGSRLWRLNLGIATFFAGRAEVEHHNTFKAIRYARAGRDILRDLIKEYPDTEDAYFVLGMYEYLAGSVPRSLRWLTFLLDISGDRELGIRYLERATSRAEIMAPEAARMLLAAAAVQPEYAEPCKYSSLAREARKKYPQNPHYSAALQLILVHCGYPEESLAENKRAFRVYLERFPDMVGTLNLVKLQVYPAIGALDKIEKLAPVFKKENYDHWYLARAQAYDVIGNRKKAVAMYREIEFAVDYPQESTAFVSEPADLVYDKARIYLKQPFKRPEKKNYNNGVNSLALNVPGRKAAKSHTADSIGW